MSTILNIRVPRWTIYIGVFTTILIGEAFGQTFNAWLKAGDESAKSANYSEAIEYYKKALEFDTEDIALDQRLAEAYRLYKDYERAEVWYAKVNGKDKYQTYPLSLFYLAEMNKYNGKYEMACRLFGEFAQKYSNDSSYFLIKAKTESAGCEEVSLLYNASTQANVTNAGPGINSKFSDFAGSLIGDSALYYSSLRFLYEPKTKKSKPYFVARLLRWDMGRKQKWNPEPLSAFINEPSLHNTNAGFSPDYRFVVFSRCEQSKETNQLVCDLFLSKIVNGKWAKPEPIKSINTINGYTNTQPTIEARGAFGYTLYFVSDRPGGIGKMDLWKSEIDAQYNFNTPVNLGPTINTFDDELTPFFDTKNNVLYFSSYGHIGMGGQDIFKSTKIGDSFSKPVNLGKGYNSSQNDVFFNMTDGLKKGVLTSNRTGSQFISSKTCCYDIYFHELMEVIPVVEAKDSSSILDSLAKIDPANNAFYEDFLPLRLYFDNDEPDKRTVATNTKKSYDKLYYDYLSRIPEYKEKYGAGSKDRKSNDSEIDTFFVNTVTKSWNGLNSFCAKIEKAMIVEGVFLEFEIRGRASPLAETDYNLKLSSRRISSLLNYMKLYNNGKLKAYIESGRIKLVEVPAGESFATNEISDNREDLKNSVFSPRAAKERLIELIGVKIITSDQINSKE